jgi:hypothetical protein
VSVPTVEGLLTAPYVTLAEFTAAPTWLDSQDLIPGGTDDQQEEELYNVLLRASDWADTYCGLRLGGHTAFEQARVPVDRWGNALVHPSDIPLRQVTAFAYSSNFQDMITLSSGDLASQVWIEDARGFIVATIQNQGAYLGSLQFGGVRASADEAYCQFQYTAGYATTVLAADADAGATSIVVSNPAAIMPPATPVGNGLAISVPGSTLRIWDPGLEEAVTVTSGYTAGDTTVPLSGALLNSHAAGAGVSEMPPAVHQAIVALAVALLMRQDVTSQEPFAGTPYGPTLRRSSSGGQAGGLVDTAWQLLDPYRRVR